MKCAVFVFGDELETAPSLLEKINSLDFETELWVLGAAGNFPLSSTGASRIVEVSFHHEEVLREPCACAEAVFELFSDSVPELIITSAGIRGDELAAQLSLLTNSTLALGAGSIFNTPDGIIIRKSVYAGNLTGEFLCRKLPLAMSISGGSGNGAFTYTPPEILRLVSHAKPPLWLCSPEYNDTKKAHSLSDARLVVAAGRGAGKADNFKKLDLLAKKLGGVLGGSRPTVCDGKLPADRLIGISGIQIKPELCLVFGASGAAAFMTGIEHSRHIVAVNRDPNALIFENCDLGIVADCGEFANALMDILGEN